MLSLDVQTFVALRNAELMREAEQERLAAQLPHQNTHPMRRELASLCQRIANWLDERPQYLQTPDPGLEDWDVPWARV